MKPAHLIFVVIISVLMGIAIYGFLLPNTSHVERSITISASPEEIFPYLNNVKMFDQWSPWMEYDPKVVIEYSGPEEGIGAHSGWSSEHPKVGHGSRKIINSNANQLVEMELDFGDGGKAFTRMELQALADITKVTWRFRMPHGNNIYARYIGLLIEGMVGPDYERGLQNLKQKVEGS